MPRFFVSADQVSAGRAVLTGADAEHLGRSLRARPGETVVVVDSSGQEHGVRLDEVAPGRAGGAITWSRPATGDPELEVHVIQAVAKDGMDHAVDGMASLGVASIRPCISERTIVRLDASRQARRVKRWQEIARQAAQLAGRARIPRVHPVTDVDGAVAGLPRQARILACIVSGATVALSHIQVTSGRSMALCIGPEGGFSPAEIARLTAAGAEGAHLGPRILRARVAGMVAVGLVLAAAGELDGPLAAPPMEAAGNRGGDDG